MYHASLFLQVVQAGRGHIPTEGGASEMGPRLTECRAGVGPSGEEAGEAGRGGPGGLGARERVRTLPLKEVRLHLERSLWMLHGGQLGRVRQGPG